MGSKAIIAFVMCAVVVGAAVFLLLQGRHKK